jgi:hypothetical protein
MFGKNESMNEEDFMDDLTNRHDVDRFSITPSGFFGNSADNIVSLENFMTEEEIEAILDQIFSKHAKDCDCEQHTV